MQTKFSEKELEFRLNNDLTDAEVFKKLFLENKLYVIYTDCGYVGEEFLYNSFRKKYWESYTKLLDSSIIKDFVLYVKVLNEVCPNQWDFSYIVMDNNKILLNGFHIKFDKFKINNNTGFSHTIENLIVTLFLHYNTKLLQFKFFNFLYGNRTILTESEYKSDYLHSHLNYPTKVAFFEPKEKFDTNSRFCLGSSELSKILSSQLNIRDNDVEKTFRNILLNIYSTISYESLEGVPYRNISNISNSNTRRASSNYFTITSLIKEMCHSLLLKIKEDKIPFNVNFMENTIKVNLPQESERKLIEFILQDSIYCQSNIVYYKNADGVNYIYEKGASDSNSALKTDLFTVFKAKKLPYEIKKEEKKKESIQLNLSLEEKVKDFLCILLEYTLNEMIHISIREGNSNTNN